MRICFISDFHRATTGDIGTKSVARHLAAEIAKRNAVLRVDVRDLIAVKKLRDFRPDLLHFVLAPTAIGLIVTQIFARLCADLNLKVVVSAPNPTLSHRWLLTHLRPDLILTQALESEQAFQNLRFETRFLPNGVDTNRFVPASPHTKNLLRDKHAIPRDKFVILHVGPVIRERSIERMAALHDGDSITLVVGREGSDRSLLAELKKNGFTIFNQYLKHIEEIYALSDCYAFPTHPANRGASIEIPLSVLEAMACNVPVISTTFGALPRMFRERGGFFFIKTDDEMYALARTLRQGGVEVATRHMVLPYSWNAVAKTLEELYYQLLH